MRTAMMSALLAALGASVRADVRLVKVLTDHVVLQRGMPIRIWGWADADEAVSVEFNGKSANAKADASGRWLVELPAMEADGKPRTLTVRGRNTIELADVLLGEVWLAVGQSNMSRGLRYVKDRVRREPMDLRNLRLFFVGLDQVPRRQEPEVVKGWAPATHESMNAVFVHPTLGPYEFSEVGYYFGKGLHEALGVPVGVISAAFPGSTASQWTPVDNPNDRFDFTSGKPDKGPGSMYQSMLNGLPPLAVRGVIWYQGENDASNPRYEADLRKLIETWRSRFRQPELAFLMTQLAQTTFNGGILSVTEVQQRIVESVAHTGLAPSNDLWDAGDLGKAKVRTDRVTGWPTVGGGDPHPPNKHIVAARLARIALAQFPGKVAGEVFGPTVAGHEIRGDRVTVRFKNAGKGLKTDDGAAPCWFQLAGADGRFVNAAAAITGPDTVELRAEGVAEPKLFRFAWNTLARHNLCNADGLPAIPHRGDAPAAAK